MKSGSQSSLTSSLFPTSSFELRNDKTCLKFKMLKQQNQNLTENRSYNHVFLYNKYLCFFGEEIKTLSNILAFDMNSSEWMAIPIEAPSSQIFTAGSHCNICPYHSGFCFHGSAYSPFIEIITLSYSFIGSSSSFKAKWSNVTINNLPFRKNHSSSMIKNQLYVFGGLNSNNQLCNNDLSVINLGI